MKELVIASLAQITGLDPSEVETLGDLNLFENGILDSLSFVNLISLVEQGSGKSFDLSRFSVENASTMDTLIEALANYPA